MMKVSFRNDSEESIRREGASPEIERFELDERFEHVDDGSDFAKPRTDDAQLCQPAQTEQRFEVVEKVEVEVQDANVRDEVCDIGGERGELTHGEFEVCQIEELLGREAERQRVPRQVESLDIPDRGHRENAEKMGANATSAAQSQHVRQSADSRHTGLRHFDPED